MKQLQPLSKVNIDFTIEELETDDPETLRIDLNKCRRQWDDAEGRTSRKR